NRNDIIYMLFQDLPLELQDIILSQLDTVDILLLGKRVVSEYVWLRKKDRTITEAAKNGNLVGLKYLVDLGADIHTNNEQALRCSAANGHLELVKYLVNLGADIHADNDRSIYYSASNGHLEVVKYFVDQGADIQTKNEFALHQS